MSMNRDQLDTPRTWRARLANLLIGRTQRTAEILAGIALCISKGSLTSIDAETFGLLNNAAADNSCSITSGDKTLTSPNNPWTSADVGKTIHVQKAGVSSATLTTTIASYTSAGEIELTDAAGTTVAASKTSAAGVAVWGDGEVAVLDETPILNADGQVIQSGTLDTPEETNITKIRVVGTSGDAAYSVFGGGYKYTIASDDVTVVLLPIVGGANVRVYMPETETVNGREITLVRLGGDGLHHVEPYNAANSLESLGSYDSSNNAIMAPTFTLTYKYSTTLGKWYIKSFASSAGGRGALSVETGISAYGPGGAANATLLDAKYTFHNVTGVGTPNASVKLPTILAGRDGSAVVESIMGQTHFVFNADVNPLNLVGSDEYGSNADKINGVDGDTGITIPAGGMAICYAMKESDGGLGGYSEWKVLVTASASRASLGLDTTDSPQFAGLNVGDAADTTITRTGAGDIGVEGNRIFRVGGTDVPVADGGTGASTAAEARTNLGITSADGTINLAIVTERFDDFLHNNATTAGGMFAWSNIGGGHTPVSSTTLQNANHPGVIQFGANSGSSDFDGCYTAIITAFLKNNLTFRALMIGPVLSDVTDEYRIKVGFDRTASGALSAAGIWLTYDRVTYGDNWQLICRTGGTSTVVDTGVAYAAATWQNVGFVVNAAGTSVQAYIDGVAVGTAISTNIPTEQDMYGYFALTKTAGTNQRLAGIDYFYMKYDVTR